MRNITLPIFVYFACLLVQAQTSQKLTTERNAYRSGDQIVKQQIEFKDPGSSGKDSWLMRHINLPFHLCYIK